MNPSHPTKPLPEKVIRRLEQILFDLLLVGGAGALPWFVLACKCAGSGSREDLMELIKMKQERKFIFPPSLQSVAVKIEQYFQLLSKMTSTDCAKEDYAELKNIFEVR